MVIVANDGVSVQVVAIGDGGVAVLMLWKRKLIDTRKISSISMTRLLTETENRELMSITDCMVKF